jgi:hypothetical protein
MVLNACRRGYPPPAMVVKIHDHAGDTYGVEPSKDGFKATIGVA